MSKIVIKRKNSFFGSALKMICYINNNEICRIKENENYVFNGKKENYEFKCKLSMNPISDTYYIDLKKNKNAVIVISAGGLKPKIVINYIDTLSDDMKKIEKISNFKITKKIDTYLYINEYDKTWTIPDDSFSTKISNIYRYSDILDFELIENEHSESKIGLTGAAIGGVLFGGAGAIIGANTGKTKEVCHKLQIKITLNDFSNSTLFITLIDSDVYRDTTIYKNAYKNAQKIISLLQIMHIEASKSREGEFAISDKPSIADEIKKYKELLDCGAITKEEFEKLKKELIK